MTDQELKDLVAGLAVSGERVERTLDRLAEETRLSQERFERRQEEARLRQEEARLRQEETDQQLKKTARVVEELGRKVDNICERNRSVDEQLEKTEKVIAELGRKVDKVCERNRSVDEQLEKTEKVIAELGRKVDKVCGKVGGTDEQLGGTDRQMTELNKVMEALGRRVDKVCGKVGGIDENLGHHAEQFFQDVFARKMEFGGVIYDRIQPNYICQNRKKEMIEVDIAMFNGESVALIEVKNRIHPDFVKEFTEERVKKFKKLCREYKNYKLYLGIAGFSFDQKVLAEAKKHGIGVVKQAGEGIEVEADCLKAY